MAWWLFAVARACGTPAYETRVVGWSTDGAAAVLRDEQRGYDPCPEDAYLTLRLVDLASGRLERSWIILSNAEKSDAALRGARWKAAEAELVARKVAFDGGLAPSAGPWTLPGADGPLVIDGGGCDDESMTWALSGPHTRVVLRAVPVCTAEAMLSDWKGWIAPGGVGLYLTARPANEGPTFERWIPRSSVGGKP